MQTSKQRGEPFSQHTLNAILKNVKDFFEWLSYEGNYKKYIKPTDIAYLKASLKEIAMVRKASFVSFASIEELEKVIFHMQSETDIQKRNRDLVAFTLLTGVRDGTLKGFKLKLIDLEKGSVHQDLKYVETIQKHNSHKTSFQRGFYKCGYFLPLTPHFQTHSCGLWRSNLHNTRAIQGVEPKPRTRTRFHHFYTLWQIRSLETGGGDEEDKRKLLNIIVLYSIYSIIT
jgi:integrase